MLDGNVYNYCLTSVQCKINFDRVFSILAQGGRGWGWQRGVRCDCDITRVCFFLFSLVGCLFKFSTYL